LLVAAIAVAAAGGVTGGVGGGVRSRGDRASGRRVGKAEEPLQPTRNKRRKIEYNDFDMDILFWLIDR
jgi:hypothetical protein